MYQVMFHFNRCSSTMRITSFRTTCPKYRYISSLNTIVKVKVMFRPTVSRPVYLGVKPHLRPKTKFLLLSDICGFVHVGRLLWREGGSVVYNFCWTSQGQSFSGPSPEGLMNIFYCLRLEIPPPTGRIMSPSLYHPGQGWPSYTPGQRVPFSSPLTTRGAKVEVFEPASTRGSSEG
jgi:hypothetical protein